MCPNAEFKHDDFKRTEFIYVGMKTFKNHCVTNYWSLGTKEASQPIFFHYFSGVAVRPQDGDGFL